MKAGVKKEARTLMVAGETILYTLERKRQKNIHLRIKAGGEIYVSAPPSTPLSRIEAFLCQQLDFIRRAVDRLEKRRAAAPPPLTLSAGEVVPIFGVLHTIALQKGGKRGGKCENGVLTLTLKDPTDPAGRRAAFAAFLDGEARRCFEALTQGLLPLFAPTPAEMPSLTLRTMTSKWGVCRPRQGRITLNKSLVYLPPHLIEYVICHELAHFRHPDHSAAFWAYLTEIMPDCRARRRALNECVIPTLL